MSDIVETAPRAVPRDRSVEARRAARQAKATQERRFIESLNRGVSVAVIAVGGLWGEAHARAGSRHSRSPHARAARAVPRDAGEPSRALHVSFCAMSGSNIQAVDRVVKIVRELDRYHGFVAAERWGLPVASEGPKEIPHGSRRTSPSRLARKWRRKGLKRLNPRSEMVWPRKHLTPKIWYQRRNGAASAPAPAGQTRCAVEAPLAGPEMAAQKLEKTESPPGKGMAPEGSSPQDLAPACEPLVSPTAANPNGARRVSLRMTLNGVVDC
jgi:hypothetical protein